MAITFDAGVDAGGFTSLGTRSWTHVTGSGSNRALYVVVNFWNSGGTVSSITYNSVGLTLALRSGLSTRQDRVEIWRLINPPSGSFTVLVTFSATADGETGSVSLNGVHQTVPEGNTNTNTGTAIGGSGTHSSVGSAVTGAVAGDAAIDGITWSDRQQPPTITMNAQTGRTQLAHTSNASGEGGASSYLIGPTDPQTLDWTFVAGVSNNDWMQAGLVIKAAAGAAATSFPPFRRPFRFFTSRR